MLEKIKLTTFESSIKHSIKQFKNMTKVIKLKKGLDIRLQGKPQPKLANAKSPSVYALKPSDFPGLTPKLSVQVDQEVKAGTELFFDKYNPEVKYTSPVSGKVVAVNRGERRRILEVVVEADGKNESLNFTKANPLQLSREEIVKNLLESGNWTFIRQRPYAIVANPQHSPKSVFVSTFDSAPMAPDYQFIMKDKLEAFQTGINALSKLTTGKVYLGLDAKISNNIFDRTENAEKVYFDGPHPAGTVGVQIHHTDPINKGEVVWYANVQDVVNIGQLFLTGKVNFEKIIALTGSEVKDPQYYQTIVGASIKDLLQDKVNGDNNRIISGNILSGAKVSADNFLGFYDAQITVIPEGNEPELFGWATPGFGKFSMSRAFFSWINPNKEYRLDSNLRGGHRPFVVTGQYEKVVPMDILPVHLLKAIIIEDIDLMEQLGIYEIAEEELALCEVVCTSKTPVQAIVRKGIDLMIKEFN